MWDLEIQGKKFDIGEKKYFQILEQKNEWLM